MKKRQQLTASNISKQRNTTDVFNRFQTKLQSFSHLCVRAHPRLYGHVKNVCMSTQAPSRSVSVTVYAEAQRYCFGDRYELCMEQREILKIYFSLSANYSVSRHNRGAWVPPWWEGQPVPPVLANANQQLSLCVSVWGFPPLLMLRFPMHAIQWASGSTQQLCPSNNELAGKKLTNVEEKMCLTQSNLQNSGYTLCSG